ncbi:hypothetical protein VTK73DRAFT_687 [Phialemonium thermophilum]|uniref:Calcium uniporter protein, mitochondrial n=1 Tax=Phialemonium thermophilum TaxID=223376 RepID=A0ABR3VUK8_9PEZI
MQSQDWVIVFHVDGDAFPQLVSRHTSKPAMGHASSRLLPRPLLDLRSGSATPLIARPLRLFGTHSRPCRRPLSVSQFPNAEPARPAVARRASLHSSPCRRVDESKYEQKAKELNQKGLDEEEQEVRVRQNQIKRPWHREGADKPPVSETQDDMKPMTKGKLLTTPTRLLKLVLPLPIAVQKDLRNNQKKGHDGSQRDYARAISHNDEIQPLALLVHPQQPLSYVERLIQAELPPIVEDGKEKVPNVYFCAEDAEGSQNRPTARDETGPQSASRRDREQQQKKEQQQQQQEEEEEEKAEREKNMGYGVEMRVEVPSFNDRTYYMRVRLRAMGRRIDEMARIKRECDLLAHRGANRLAKAGFGVLTAWWGIVYWGTFHTQLGWDMLEPVTYLAGLATIMGGYLWFLYISRDLSYKAAMNVTVSRRQHALYEARGFDLHKWEQLLAEAGALRDEIKKVAIEYDVDWDESRDVGDAVKRVLDKEQRKQGGGPRVEGRAVWADAPLVRLDPCVNHQPTTSKDSSPSSSSSRRL